MVRMRIALFGGTFDPIHRGHLALASAAARAFPLDRVLFAPAGRQPRNAESPPPACADRLEMTRLAVASAANPSFAVSSVDAPRPDGAPNYTVDTLAALARAAPAATLFVLAGADSFLTLRNWRSPAQLLALAEWIRSE